MEENEFANEVPADKWVSALPELTLPELDHLERDGVTIQCINSSDFVIGKQTNFNGPVTIISCAEVLKQERYLHSKSNEEEVVIEDKVLSPSAAMKVQKIAEEKEKSAGENSDGQDKEKTPKYITTRLKIAFLILGLLISLITGLVFLFAKESEAETGTDNPVADPICAPLPGNFCIYSEVSWGGPFTAQKPLKTPVPYIVISETGDDFCYRFNDCVTAIKSLKAKKNQTNVNCNFFLGGDGNAYEGGGWSWENSLEGPVAGKSLQLCFIGEHLFDWATYPQLVLAKMLIQYAVDNNYVSKDYVLLTTNDRERVTWYETIKKWPHFEGNPFSE